MVEFNKLKNGEYSLRVDKLGTINFPLPFDCVSTKGHSGEELIKFIVDKANKNYITIWKACPRDVAFGNVKEINKLLVDINYSKELKEEFEDIKSVVNNNFKDTNNVITSGGLKKLSQIKHRQFLDRTNEATRLQLDFLICSGIVEKTEQASESDDSKKSYNKYIYSNKGICPYLVWNDSLSCYQCSCKNKDFKIKEKGIKLNDE